MTTIEDACSALNDMLVIDRECMSKLIETRFECSPIFAALPSVQVVNKNGSFNLGIVGVLNGIFGGGICCVKDGDGILKKFMSIDSFEKEHKAAAEAEEL